MGRAFFSYRSINLGIILYICTAIQSYEIQVPIPHIASLTIHVALDRLCVVWGFLILKIGRLTSTIHVEYQMQDDFQKYLEEIELLRIQRNNRINIQPIVAFARELHVPEIGRIADFLILSGSRLVCVEAKCYNLAKMICQLDDHAKYADYCFAYILDYTITPRHIKERLINSGYGLIVYNEAKGIVTEVLEAHQNKKTDKALRHEVIKRVKDNTLYS